MQYEGVDSVAICRATDKMHRFVSRSYLQWRLAGADTAIDIAAHYAAGARWPNSILPFIEKYPPRIVRVNHVFRMLFGSGYLHEGSIYNRLTPITSLRYTRCSI